MRRLATTISLVLLVACSKVEKRELLPWFLIKTTHYAQIGGFAGGSTTTEYYVRRFGLWRKLNLYGGGATVVDPMTVAFYAGGQMQVIHKGESAARPACPSSFAFATISPTSRFIDCVEVVEGPARAVATRLRFRRFNASGALLQDRVLGIESGGRTFLTPAVEFYDDADHPYFVTMNPWPAPRPACAIVTIENRSMPGPANIAARDCSEPATWSPMVGRPLRLH